MLLQSKQNGENFENKIEIWYPNYSSKWNSFHINLNEKSLEGIEPQSKWVLPIVARDRPTKKNKNKIISPITITHSKTNIKLKITKARF